MSNYSTQCYLAKVVCQHGPVPTFQKDPKSMFRLHVVVLDHDGRASSDSRCDRAFAQRRLDQRVASDPFQMNEEEYFTYHRAHEKLCR